MCDILLLILEKATAGFYETHSASHCYVLQGNLAWVLLLAMGFRSVTAKILILHSSGSQHPRTLKAPGSGTPWEFTLQHDPGAMK